MQTNFSPSVNIVRDFDNEVNYIPTANSQRIFSQLINDYQIGTRSFNIIGSYGTGKSAFLLAFEQHLNGKKDYFRAINGHFKQNYNFEFLNVVGEYTSIIDAFAHHLNLQNNLSSNQSSDKVQGRLIIKNLEQYYQHLALKNACLVIVIDEFGKFLEYASANNPERELYFIQELAEFANNPAKNILLLTVLHQSFDEYARRLNKAQRQEWEKVKGRLKEVVFNEPVEQLLFLAADRLESKNFSRPADFDPGDLLEAIENSNVFPLRAHITPDLTRKLYPFDVLSAAILTAALQTYGQNERSLFTFLESDDYLGLNSFNPQKSPYYNICNVYDYLLNNFSSLLTTKYNPHFFQWRAIQNSIDRVDATLDKNNLEAALLVKIIGLLNIFASAGARVDTEFLVKYAHYSLGINNADAVLKELENRKIIRFLNYKNQFILFEGTDLDIELEIQRAVDKVVPVTDIVTTLRKHFSFPYLSAKAVHYKIGTPRFFNFHFSEAPIDKKPKGQIDGIINLIFSANMSPREVIEHSKNIEEAIIFGLYRNTEKIRDILFEIRKIQYVIDNLVDDRVAERELRNMLQFQKQELNQCVLNNLYRDTDEVVWIFQGQEIRIDSRSRFNNLLSEICEETYPGTPIFKNELINREKLPSAISKARKNLLDALINRWDQEDLGFQKDAFPPEKTIYLAMLKQTGMHRKEGDTYTLGQPTDESFQTLWAESEAFLEKAKFTKKNLGELIESLSSKPFKLKRGFIDFWVPIFLFIKREDYALFGEDGFIPVINTEAFDLIVKTPQKFEIKTFELEGIKLDLFKKYRAFLNQTPDKQPSTSSFVETIKPFLSFYRSLPDYSQRTKRLSKSALNLREAIATATEPDKTFFEDFPQALGYSTLNLNESEEALADYIIQLQNSIREIRGCFDALLNRIEAHLLSVTGYEGISFPEYQAEIRERYKSLKTQLLLPHQNVFFRQLTSELDERNAWLRAIVQALLGKPIEKMRDEEEELILDKMSNAILELDNLCDISKIEVNPQKEEIVKLDITTLDTGRKSQLLRLSRMKEKQVSDLKKKLKADLGKDKTANIAALIKLLREEFSDE